MVERFWEQDTHSGIRLWAPSAEQCSRWRAARFSLRVGLQAAAWDRARESSSEVECGPLSWTQGKENSSGHPPPSSPSSSLCPVETSRRAVWGRDVVRELRKGPCPLGRHMMWAKERCWCGGIHGASLWACGAVSWWAAMRGGPWVTTTRRCLSPLPGG